MTDRTNMFEVLNKDDSELLDECDVHTTRGSGPGGTKSDTSESAVEIRHRPSDVTARSSRTRSQQKNREIALKKLRREYARSVRHDIDPSRIGIPPSLQDYIDQNLKINRTNQWYPFLVKLILDVFDHYEARLSPTADFLNVSTGALVRFFNKDPSLWKQVNELREQYDHKKLTS